MCLKGWNGRQEHSGACTDCEKITDRNTSGHAHISLGHFGGVLTLEFAPKGACLI